MIETATNPTALRPAIYFTEVTLRDGEQQTKAEANMPIEDRIGVFDQILNTGISRVEIGHLGNEHDAAFARELVSHINQRADAGDRRYKEVELQVLFGTQLDKAESIEALAGFDPDRVIAHVYDRASPELRRLAQEPYSLGESALRIVEAASSLIDKGYKHFSISGEGAVDPNLAAATAGLYFYLPVVSALRQRGAEKINVNLPDTFGSSLGGEWNASGLLTFNELIKNAFPDVTTSIHVHNDHNSAVETTITALEVGFDAVEGTLFGMGERSGNVALADVMVNLLESARHIVELTDRWAAVSNAGRVALATTIWGIRQLDPALLENADNWYAASRNIAVIYDTVNRFHRTSLGNPEAYDAGCGPHAQANREALKDPVNRPLWRNYGRVALIHAMLGRPEAEQIINVDLERYRAIALLTHAAGGSTRDVHEMVEECSKEQRQQAIALARQEMAKITAVASGQIPSLAPSTVGGQAQAGAQIFEFRRS